MTGFHIRLTPEGRFVNEPKPDNPEPDWLMIVAIFEFGLGHTVDNPDASGFNSASLDIMQRYLKHREETELKHDSYVSTRIARAGWLKDYIESHCRIEPNPFKEDQQP